MVIHAPAEIAGRWILAVDDAADCLADVVAVEPEVRVLAGGQEDHQGQAGDARALFAVGPVAFLGLRVGQVLQTAVVHFAHVARDDFADFLVGELRTGGGGHKKHEKTRKEG